MNPLISVIVPVYNGEAYIEKCFTSIINQTYKNLEVIIINDGSKDQSPEICDRFREKDDRIIVIHQENEGLSAVRNKGIRMASGAFIGFVDSDDSIHPRMYEILLTYLLECEADIAMCEVASVYQENVDEEVADSNKQIEEQEITSFKRDEAFGNLFNQRNLITVVPWNKLYKKEVFTYVRYPDGKVHDDEFVIHHIIQTTRKIILTDAVLYYYYHNEASFTKERYNLKRLDAIEALKDRVLFFESQKYDKLLQKMTHTYLHLIIIHYYLVLKYCPAEKEVQKKLKKTFKADYHRYKNNIRSKNKMEFNFFSIHPAIYSGFIKVRKNISNLLTPNRT